MNYIYHMVPDNMKGEILYPLSMLKRKYPKLYKKEAEKYIKRKHIMKIKIPKFNCKWNDVLHLTPVNPLKIKAALRKSVPLHIKMKTIKWFKISSALLDKKSTLIWLDKEKEFVSFDKNKLGKYNKVPEETIAYYKSCFKSKERPLLFHLIPHVLYKGAISIKDMKTIKI